MRLPGRLSQFAENIVLVAIFALITAASGLWAQRVQEQRPALERGKDYARLGLRLQARAAFREAVREAPKDVYAHYRYVGTFGRFEGDAIREYAALAAREPGSAVAAFGLGYAYAVDHQFEEAMPRLRRALELEPGLLYAEFALGQAYYVGMKDLDAAEARYRAETARNPSFERPYMQLAELEMERDRPAEAVRILQEGRAKADEPWVFNASLYRILFYGGDYRGSLDYFLKFHMPHRYAPLTFFLATFCFFFWLYVMRAERVTESVSWRTMTAFVALGVLSVAPVHVLNLAINRGIPERWREHLLYDLLYSFLGIASVEETAKLVVLTLGLLGRRAIRNPLQGVALGTSVALGFSFYENYIYLVAWGPQAVGDRFFQSVLLHVSCTGVAGYHVGRGAREGRLSTAAKGLGIAVLLHGAFNFVLFSGRGLGGFAIVILGAATYGFSYLLYRAKLEVDEPLKPVNVNTIKVVLATVTWIFFFIPTYLFLRYGVAVGLLYAFTSITPVIVLGSLHLFLASRDYWLSRARFLALRERWEDLEAETRTIFARVQDPRARGAAYLYRAYARYALGRTKEALAAVRDAGAEGLRGPEHDLLALRTLAEEGRLEDAEALRRERRWEDDIPEAYAEILLAAAELGAGRATVAFERASAARERLLALRAVAFPFRTIPDPALRAVLGWRGNVELALGVMAGALLAMGKDAEARAVLRGRPRRLLPFLSGAGAAPADWVEARLEERAGRTDAGRKRRLRAEARHFGRPIAFLRDAG